MKRRDLSALTALLCWTTACASPRHVQLPERPPITAPYADRRAYVDRLSPLANVRNDKIRKSARVPLVGGMASWTVPIRVGEVVVAGESIEHPIDLLPAVAPDSFTANRARAFAELEEDTATGTAVGWPLTLGGVGLILGSPLVAVAADLEKPGLLYAMSGIGLLLLLAGGGVLLMRPSPETISHQRATAYENFAADLDRALGICRTQDLEPFDCAAQTASAP